jgi:hypothetical protein
MMEDFSPLSGALTSAVLPSFGPLLMIPLSQIRDNGIINNGSKQPTVANLEAQVKAGMSISLMDLAAAAHRERDAGERKTSVLEQLKSQPAQERPHKTAPKKSAEKEL